MQTTKGKYRAECCVYNLSDSFGEDWDDYGLSKPPPPDAWEYRATLFDLTTGEELDSWDSFDEGFWGSHQFLSEQEAQDMCDDIKRDTRAGHAHRWFNYDGAVRDADNDD
mgnify:FL=1